MNTTHITFLVGNLLPLLVLTFFACIGWLWLLARLTRFIIDRYGREGRWLVALAWAMSVMAWIGMVVTAVWAF
jgi:hypothetical protein